MFFCTIIKKNLFQTKDTANHPVPFEVLMIVINAKSGADVIINRSECEKHGYHGFYRFIVRTKLPGTDTAPYVLFRACMERTELRSFFMICFTRALSDAYVSYLNPDVDQMKLVLSCFSRAWNQEIGNRK